MVDEANAIGTAYLRAQMLPASVRGETLQLLREYVDVRVEGGAVTLADAPKREGLLLVPLVFLIVDLDRPRRGLIEVSQQSLRDLQSAMRAE